MTIDWIDLRYYADGLSFLLLLPGPPMRTTESFKLVDYFPPLGSMVYLSEATITDWFKLVFPPVLSPLIVA